MKVIFLLIIVSDGIYNRGNVFVREFTTQQSCEFVAEEINDMSHNVKAKCVGVNQ